MMTTRALDWDALVTFFAGMPGTARNRQGGVEPDPAAVQERAEERAAILEYDEGLTRAAAEAVAFGCGHKGRRP